MRRLFILLLLTALPLPAEEAKEVSFEEDIQPLLSNYCYRCHGEEKQKGDLDLSGFKDEAAILSQREIWLEVLHQLREEEMPTKEPLPSREERQRLVDWIDGAVNNLDWTKVRNAGHVTIPRLTKTEYGNTMRDLLGMDFDPAVNFSDDGEGRSGFTTDRDALFITPAAMEKYFEAAERALEAVIAISLDQLVAQKVGQETAFESLVLGTEPPRQGGEGGNAISFANTVSWSSPTTRVSPEINPRVAFDRLFRSNDGPAARRNAELRKSVVDLVLDDAKSLRGKASRLDQHKIDEYLESVRSLEKQIDKTLDPPERAWTPPTRPGEEDMVRPPEGLPRNRDEHLRMMMDILVLSLWTDTTRVGTLMTAHGFSRQNFSFLDGVTNDHHGISHHKEQKGAVEQYTKVSRWYVSQFAYLLERLRSIDEGHGTLLDNSIVLYGSGMKDGNGHKRDNLPILVAGRGGGAIHPRGHVPVKGQPLANLHLTIAQKFGIETDDFNGVGISTVSEIG